MSWSTTLALADPGTRDSRAVDRMGSGTAPAPVGRGEIPLVGEAVAVGLCGEGETGTSSAALSADIAPVEIAAPVGSDLVGEFSLPPVVNEVAAAVERFAVRVEDEVADGGETWAVVLGLTALAGEIARRQLWHGPRRRKPEPGGWGDGHAL